jgi:hypothetical protein
MCYYDRRVRALYAARSNGRRGLDNSGRERPLPPPTTALPGSPEKIAILQQRAAQGLELWHPDDERLDRRILRRRVG